VRDVRLVLEGKSGDLTQSLTERMMRAAEAEQYELAAKYRDLISTVEELSGKQRMAAADGDDSDVFGYHYENGMLAVNLFHVRKGRVLDRRELFWEHIPEFGTETSDPARTEHGEGNFSPSEFFSALLKQIYIDQHYVPHTIYVPVDFEDSEALEQLLAESRGRHVHILNPQRGDKRALVDLVARNAKQSYDQRFRILKPNAQIIASALQEALTLPNPRAASSASISRTYRAAKRWRRWLSGKTGR
jgi:excinuclease ABC subunit C